MLNYQRVVGIYWWEYPSIDPSNAFFLSPAWLVGLSPHKEKHGIRWKERFRFASLWDTWLKQTYGWYINNKRYGIWTIRMTSDDFGYSFNLWLRIGNTTCGSLPNPHLWWQNNYFWLGLKGLAHIYIYLKHPEFWLVSRFHCPFFWLPFTQPWPTPVPGGHLVPGNDQNLRSSKNLGCFTKTGGIYYKVVPQFVS